MPRHSDVLAVLKPLGLLTHEPVPPARETLMAGFALGFRLVHAGLPPARKRLDPSDLARALPKGAAIQGDILVRPTTGLVYTRTARSRDSLVEEGSLLEWFGWPDPGRTEIGVQLTYPPDENPERAHADGVFRDLAPPADTTRLDRAGLVNLALAAIDACGRRRCNDQRVRARPTDFVTLTTDTHSAAA